MLNNRNQKKRDPEEKLPVCALCYKPVHKGADGGEAVIPTSVSGLPQRNVFLHNACLNPFIEATEAARRPITDRTIFFKNPETKQMERSW